MGDVYLPILKDTKDPHYRYKMPKLTAKVEGSGNGIKTVITNMSAIARAIGRPASYPTKYFGCELGANVTMNNEFIVNGSHDAEKLLNLLYSFIQKFVLCSKCKNPETTLTVSGQVIRQKCIACGHEATIPKTLHKLTTFIINHPPEGSQASQSTSGKGGKSSKKGKDKSSKTNGNHSPTNNGGTTTSHQRQDDIADDFQDDGEDGFDDDELTAEAYNERMRNLGETVNAGLYIRDAKESAKLFSKLVQEKKEQLDDVSVQKELVKEAEKLEIKDKAVLILAEVLFSEKMFDEIKKHRMIFLRFTHKNAKAQKYLLGAYEKLVGDEYKDQLFGSSMKILKQFYDEDILEEASILEWSAKESKKYVGKEMSKKIHDKVAPFIEWLKTAEAGEPARFL